MTRERGPPVADKPPLTPEQIREALGATADLFREHVDHAGWEQVGLAVFCSCGKRLFIGKMPGAVRPTA